MTWGSLKYGGVGEQWWGLAAGSCQVHPVGDLAGLGSDRVKAICKAVRTFPNGVFSMGKAWGGGGEGTCSICSTGEQYFGVPD